MSKFDRRVCCRFGLGQFALATALVVVASGGVLGKPDVENTEFKGHRNGSNYISSWFPLVASKLGNDATWRNFILRRIRTIGLPRSRTHISLCQA